MSVSHDPRHRLQELQRQAPAAAARWRELLRRQDERLSGRARPTGPLAEAVLLVHVPPARDDLPPLELAYELEFLRHAGYLPWLLDTAIRAPTAKPENIAEEIRRSQRPLIGLYANPAGRETAARIAACLRTDDTRFVFLFGPGLATPAAVAGLESAAAALVIGAPEITIAALLEAVAEKRDPATLPGVAGGCAHAAHPFRPRPPLADAGQLPAPTYEDFDLSSYPTRALPLAFNPGDAALRARSPERLIAEIRSHRRLYGIRHFVFADEIGAALEPAVSEFAVLLAAAGLDARFRLDLAYSLTPTRLLARRLARAGCYQWRLPPPQNEDERRTLDVARENAAAVGITVSIYSVGRTAR